jgi:hypothetical protein
VIGERILGFRDTEMNGVWAEEKRQWKARIWERRTLLV